MDKQDWDELIRVLRDTSNIDEAAAAATRLHKSATSEDLPRLMELLKDDDFFVREAAAWPVSELAGPAALEALLAAYQRGLDQGHDNDGVATALIELMAANRGSSQESLHGLVEAQNGDMRQHDL